MDIFIHTPLLRWLLVGLAQISGHDYSDLDWEISLVATITVLTLVLVAFCTTSCLTPTVTFITAAKQAKAGNRDLLTWATND